VHISLQSLSTGADVVGLGVTTVVWLDVVDACVVGTKVDGAAVDGAVPEPCVVEWVGAAVDGDDVPGIIVVT